MTATQNLMPPVDPAALHCAPVEVEPILPTLAWQIAADLWPDVDSIEVEKRPDMVSVSARLDPHEVSVSLFWTDGNRTIAELWDAEQSLLETVNAPDRSIATNMIERLRGER